MRTVTHVLKENQYRLDKINNVTNRDTPSQSMNHQPNNDKYAWSKQLTISQYSKEHAVKQTQGWNPLQQNYQPMSFLRRRSKTSRGNPFVKMSATF